MLTRSSIACPACLDTAYCLDSGHSAAEEVERESAQRQAPGPNKTNPVEEGTEVATEDFPRTEEGANVEIVIDVDAPIVCRVAPPLGVTREPSLSGYGECRVATPLQGFSDKNLSTESAAFVSYQPLTTALGRWPLQITFAVFGFVSTTCAAYFTVEYFGADVSSLGSCANVGYTLNILAFACTGLGLSIAVVLARCHAARYGIMIAGIVCLVHSLVAFGWFCNLDASHARMSEVLEAFITILRAFVFAQWAEMFFRSEARWPTRFVCGGLFFLMTGTIYAILHHTKDPKTWIISGTFCLICLCPVVLMVYRRRSALRAAAEAVKQDQARYDEAWLPIRHGQEEALFKLADVTSHVQGKKELQIAPDLKCLFAQAININDWYQGVVCSWALHCNVDHSPAPVKRYQRALEKMGRSYSGDHCQLVDVVRSSIIADTIDEALSVLELAIHDAHVFLIKNRFDPAYDGCATAGYRDMNLQLGFADLSGTEFEGFVFELQIHLRAIIAMKSDFGHKRYIALRNLRGD